MSRIVKGIFGGKSRSEGILQQFRPVGFATAGASGRFANNTYTVTPTAERTGAIGDVVSGFNRQARAFRNLRGQVTPGFGRLSEVREEGLRSRITALRGTARRTVGNIREELARRRLQGSSFQASEVARAEAEFAMQEDQLIADANEQKAQAFVQELGLNADLISAEFGSIIEGARTVLENLNLDTATASAMAGNASQLLADNIKAQAEARAAQQAVGESFLDNIISAFSPLGKLGA